LASLLEVLSKPESYIAFDLKNPLSMFACQTILHYVLVLTIVSIIMFQTEVEHKAKRPFRKFTYRGVDLDQLLDIQG